MSDTGTFRGYHHVTMCVNGAQEDYDFHVRVLGLRMLKRTVLLDGVDPIYHLYYSASEVGQEGTVLTTFPMRHRSAGRPGAGSTRIVALSVPPGSLEFWERRLAEHGVAAERGKRMGAERLALRHPAGISYELVEIDTDDRVPWAAGAPAEAAIRGVHGVSVPSRDLAEMRAYLIDALGFQERETEHDETRFVLGAPGAPGAVLDVTHEPDLPQGSWGYVRGLVHHVAFQIGDRPTQEAFKLRMDGMGLNDVSEAKDRNYFHSVYFRTPAGTLFEGAVTQPDGFCKDETRDELGTGLQLAPWLSDNREAITAALEPIES